MDKINNIEDDDNFVLPCERDFKIDKLYFHKFLLQKVNEEFEDNEDWKKFDLNDLRRIFDSLETFLNQIRVHN